MQILLGVCNKNANLDVWSESDLDLEDQQVIKADVIRTRQNLPLFKTEQVSSISLPSEETQHLTLDAVCDAGPERP
jgi:hypothetical protein